jgi:3',5'-cyclic AMP phosphodiesterase CpdA
MPWISDATVSRRLFLGSAVATVAARAAGSGQAHWALLSDTHIPVDPEESYRGFKPIENLKAVVPQVLKANPDGVVISGDLARLRGLPGDYQALHGLLAPLAGKTPVAMTLGNHDDRKNFQALFGDALKDRRQPVPARHVLVVEAPPVRWVILDSNIQTDFTPGLLGKAQRAWLDSYLTKADLTPTLVVFHHPPDDADGNLLDSDRLLRIVAPHRKVKALIYGHAHVYRYGIEQGIHLISLPAVGYNFNDREPVGWVDARLSASGGEFTLRALAGNKEMDGKTERLEWRA